MQPVQIRMNAAVVLLVLLLAVPLQLFLSHYLSEAYANSSHTSVEFKGPSKLGPAGERAAIQSGVGTSETKGIEAARIQAVSKLSTQMSTFMGTLHHMFKYYSSWSHIKELFLVPYRKKAKKDSAKLTLRKSGFKTELVISTKSKSGKTATSGVSSSTSSGAKQLSGSKSKSGTEKLKEVPPTSRAKEVEEYLFREVYFSHSKEPRTLRPKRLEFHVGQVIKHIQDNYHGVIVGWDPVAKAPAEWIQKHYSKRQGVVKTPHYLVLVDSRFDASGVPYHYLPQEDLEPVSPGTQVRAPELDHYFEGYSNNRHIARPWLRNLYPRDK